jgi:UPF0176 protein
MPAVAAFYRFTPLPDPAALALRLGAVAEAGAVRGTILLAPEGINGTVAGPREGVEALLASLRAIPGCESLAPQWSTAAAMPFGRLKVRLKREIVALGMPAVDARATGTRVAPADWHALLDDPDVAVIDTRNAFEVAMGSFPGAIDPATARFRDFPAWWTAHRDRLAGRRIAMLCTGGIRCEKASAWLLTQGLTEVLQLDGGILRYLAETPPETSRWQGACFVFDERGALGPGLTPVAAPLPAPPLHLCPSTPQGVRGV